MTQNNTDSKQEACKWCAQGDQPKFLDRDGTLVSITGEPGILSHAYDDSWWPCLKFGVEMHSSRASVAAVGGDAALILLDKFVLRISLELRDTDPALLSHPAWKRLIEEANALLKDKPQGVYAASSPAPAEPAQPEGEQGREVQCADCLAWFNPDSNHTCRQQVRRNQRSVK